MQETWESLVLGCALSCSCFVSLLQLAQQKLDLVILAGKICGTNNTNKVLQCPIDTRVKVSEVSFWAPAKISYGYSFFYQSTIDATQSLKFKTNITQAKEQRLFYSSKRMELSKNR